MICTIIKNHWSFNGKTFCVNLFPLFFFSEKNSDLQTLSMCHVYIGSPKGMLGKTILKFFFFLGILSLNNPLFIYNFTYNSSIIHNSCICKIVNKQMIVLATEYWVQAIYY